MSETQAAQGAEMPCPRCRVDLVMTERMGVEIDYCPKCRGVWLDRGELDKIIERSEQFSAKPADASVPPPAQSPWQAAPQGQPQQTLQQQVPQSGGWGHGHDGHGGEHGHGSYGRHGSFLGRLFG